MEDCSCIGAPARQPSLGRNGFFEENPDTGIDPGGIEKTPGSLMCGIALIKGDG